MIRGLDRVREGRLVDFMCGAVTAMATAVTAVTAIMIGSCFLTDLISAREMSTISNVGSFLE
jgi:hypothetical protein